ncbi:hypothetical protein PACTADRAFT_40162 [Pachysolen tannophilus NRRL Y-2460]|uniref:Uncharacterized protein n=1 Tax=Pachysolen tannophilus NRRL Y-2460 TaxID=669874 RepID=A0A1E4TZI7_PACTA|nr:hypothetical protein PACTADRAFT_40162 [Pachysolen tannophilus NRRL Y-2460]
MSFLSKVSLKGKTAIVTGGTKNLGALTVKELAALGANVVIHYHSSSEKNVGEKQVEELSKEFGAKAALFAGDLSKPETNEELFKFADKQFGGADIAINNAGMVLKKPIEQVTEDEFDKMVNINTKAAFFFIQSAGKHLKNGGTIISLVTSLLAAYTPFYGIYQGAKSPVEYFSKAASKELQSKAITVNCVAPGPMDTPFFYGQETPDSVAFCKSVAIGNRLTKIEDIVPIIRFLATEGYWITGQTIFASGGFTAH